MMVLFIAMNVMVCANKYTPVLPQWAKVMFSALTRLGLFHHICPFVYSCADQKKQALTI